LNRSADCLDEDEGGSSPQCGRESRWNAAVFVGDPSQVSSGDMQVAGDMGGERRERRRRGLRRRVLLPPRPLAIGVENMATNGPPPWAEGKANVPDYRIIVQMAEKTGLWGATSPLSANGRYAGETTTEPGVG